MEYMGLALSLAFFGVLAFVSILVLCNLRYEVDTESEDYKKLEKEYGSSFVYNAKCEYEKVKYYNKKMDMSFRDWCIGAKYLQDQEQKRQEQQIKYIKSLSKEELELYLLRKKAIEQIKNK